MSSTNFPTSNRKPEPSNDIPEPSTNIPTRQYWLTSNGRRLVQEEQVYIPYETQAPLVRCVVVGVEGTRFQFRIDKDAYPDGVNVYIRGRDKGSWKYWLEAKPDYPYAFRNVPPIVRYEIPSYWEFEVDEWVFGKIDHLRAVVLGRDEFGESDGRGVQTIYDLEAIPPHWQAASQDAFLVERLNSISIREVPSFSVAAPVADPRIAAPTLPLIAPPLAPPPASPIAARRDPQPTASPSSPAVPQRATEQAPTGTSFDPLVAARLAIRSRDTSDTLLTSSGRGVKRGIHGARHSTPLAPTSNRAGQHRDNSPQQQRQLSPNTAVTSFRAGKQRDDSPQEPQQSTIRPPAVSAVQAGKQRQSSPQERTQRPLQEHRQGQPRNRVQQPAPREGVQGSIVKDQDQNSSRLERQGKSRAAGPMSVSSNNIVKVSPRPATALPAPVVDRAIIVSDDSDDDTPLDKLPRRAHRRADTAYVDPHEFGTSPQPRRSGRIQALMLRSTTSATPEKFDLTPRPYVANKADIALLKSFWHLPASLLGYTITVALAIAANSHRETTEESELEEESENIDGQMWFTRRDLPEWAQLLADKTDAEAWNEVVDERCRPKAVKEVAPLPANYVRIPRPKKSKRGATRRTDPKKEQLRVVEVTGVERSKIGFKDRVMQERWDRFLGWIDIQKSQDKPERVKQQKHKGARSLPRRGR
ncbi:uncharacterized protein SRS1_13160 [Sporisorium reilianum f. sp. reilianum]|uniref:Uncharacterized protein n=1 Tax=Sporisorium reilianum f. sp. reilianum TaxID=72559 RepID=A0A2N8UBB8_9BASI|nr:uncharacterized protein SRS1_13160 [Sporisorium reilianum f. sp. reilianum]